MNARLSVEIARATRAAHRAEQSRYISNERARAEKHALLFKPKRVPVWLAPLVVTTLAVWVFADWRWMVLCLASVPFRALMLAAYQK